MTKTKMIMDAALTEVGYPNAVSKDGGRLIRFDVPPDMVFKAWCITKECLGKITFEEWVQICINHDPIWIHYFDHQKVPYSK